MSTVERTSASGKGPDDLVATLHHVDAVRARVRRETQAVWFPLVVFGALMVAGGVVVLLSGPAALAVFWPVAGTAGGVATGLWYARRERRTGACTDARPYWALVVVMLAAGVLATVLGPPLVRFLGWPLAIAAAYAGFGLLSRRTGLVTVSAALAAASVVTAALDVPRPTAVLSLAYGAAFLATGLWYRAERRDAGTVRP